MTAPHDLRGHAAERLRGERLSGRRRSAYILVLGLLMAFAPFTIDLYLPAFPAVARNLHTTDTAVQVTLTATTIGLALGQLVIGPLSDAFGRLRPLLAATSLHVLASLWIMVAPTIGLVIIGRAVQGVGAAGSGVVTMAVVRDLFSGQSLVRVLARMALVTSLAPIVAPSLGAELLRVVSWRGVFAVLAAFGITMTIASAVLLGETLPPERRSGSDIRAIGGRYRALLTDRSFVSLVVIGGMVTSTMFAYLSSSSFIYQEHFGVSPQVYGLLFAANAIGLASCAQISGRLLRRHAPTRVLGMWLSLTLLGAVLLVLADRLDLGQAIVMPLVFVVIASVGGANPTIQVTALSRHGLRAGTAGSLLGAFNFGVAGVVSPLVGALGTSVAAMGAVMIGALVLAHLNLWLIVSREPIGVIS